MPADARTLMLTFASDLPPLMMKFFVFAVIVIISVSCSFSHRNPRMQEALTGNWIMLYPDHQPNDELHERIYAKYQDSIVGLMGLKLLSFKDKGNFQLMDSFYRQSGKWTITLNELQVEAAGKGWDHFNGRLIAFRNDTLQLVEYIPLLHDSIRIIWFLRKVNGSDKASSLFEEENNIWRKRPMAPETKQMLTKKLKQVLEYYALYFEVISEESMYFVGSRTPLPFRYFRHGAGLLPFTKDDAFSRLFYNREDASTAYDLLENVYLKDRKKAFPTGDNYVIEYARFLHRLAGRLD